MYGKGGMDLGRTVTGAHCEVGRGEARKEEDGHLLREVDCKSRRCEGLLDGLVSEGQERGENIRWYWSWTTSWESGNGWC